MNESILNIIHMKIPGDLFQIKSLIALISTSNLFNTVHKTKFLRDKVAPNPHLPLEDQMSGVIAVCFSTIV